MPFISRMCFFRGGHTLSLPLSAQCASCVLFPLPPLVIMVDVIEAVCLLARKLLAQSTHAGLTALSSGRKPVHLQALALLVRCSHKQVTNTQTGSVQEPRAQEHVTWWAYHQCCTSFIYSLWCCSLCLRTNHGPSPPSLSLSHTMAVKGLTSSKWLNHFLHLTPVSD